MVVKSEKARIRDEGWRYFKPQVTVWMNCAHASRGGSWAVRGSTQRERQEERPGVVSLRLLEGEIRKPENPTEMELWNFASELRTADEYERG